MAYIGHPLLGEGKYAENKEDRRLGYSYQALWSYSLSFSVASGELDYLDGESYSAKNDKIRFLEFFPEYK